MSKIVDVATAIVARSLTEVGDQAEFTEPDIKVEHVAWRSHAAVSLLADSTRIDDYLPSPKSAPSDRFRGLLRFLG